MEIQKSWWHEMWHRVMAWVGQPDIPWVILVTASLYSLITGRSDVGVITGSLMVVAHLIFRHISLASQLKEIEYSSRESVREEPQKCLCGWEPSIYFSDDADHFYVRCDNCLRQGLPGYDADGAISEWKKAMELQSKGGIID